MSVIWKPAREKMFFTLDQLKEQKNPVHIDNFNSVSFWEEDSTKFPGLPDVLVNRQALRHMMFTVVASVNTS